MHLFKTKEILSSRDPNLDLDFKQAYPFPYIMIDDFLDEDLAKSLRLEFPTPNEKWYCYDNVFERKFATDKVDLMPWKHRMALMELNGQKMIELLEWLTGIKGLVADPWLRGGGLHYIKPGGKLDIHADFNWHKDLQLHRRLNVLIYLNDNDWEQDWRGHLELWTPDMKKCAQKISPVFNRMVCFATTDWSYHGHPDALECPPERARKSLALYYYSATRPADEITEAHSTKFVPRPNDENTEELQKLRELRNQGRLKSNVY